MFVASPVALVLSMFVGGAVTNWAGPILCTDPDGYCFIFLLGVIAALVTYCGTGVLAARLVGSQGSRASYFLVYVAGSLLLVASVDLLEFWHQLGL